MKKLIQAFAIATEFHNTQYRKATTIPYISHLMSVSALVLECGGDEELAIAALLHDAVEDADSTEEALNRRKIIEQNFGDRVLRVVDACTDGLPDRNGDKSDWHTRKRAYIAHLEHVDTDILIVSCADKFHNARSIYSDFLSIGDNVYDRFSSSKSDTLWYYQELAKVFDQKLANRLSNELKITVSMLAEK